MPKVMCFQCKTVSLVPDVHVGRKVRCKVCQAVFVASAPDGVTTAARGSTSGILTVVARRVGGKGAFGQATMMGAGGSAAVAPPSGRRWPLWIAAALAALVLPVAGAAGFVAYRWSAGGSGSAPRTGALHAGIEIGSKGVKAVVLEVFDSEHGYDVDPQAEPKTINTTLVSGLAANNQFDPQALKDTARAVGKLYEEARTERKVAEEHIYIVGSSGLFSPLRKKKNLSNAQRQELIRKNKEALAQAVREAVGQPIRFIDAADEAEQSFKGIVPRPYAEESVLYDIGSGNTKGACASSAKTYDTLELPYGTKTYFEFASKEARRTGRPFKAEARRAGGAALRQPLHAEIERKHGFVNRRRVYLSGGLVWALANYVHPANRRAMVVLTADDLDQFEKMLDQDRKTVIADCLARVAADEKTPKGQAEKVQKEVEKEINRVQDTFSPDELRAGLEVLRSLADEGEFNDKTVFFARHGYFGWILSYVAEKGAK